jgi:hypothetical protein
MQMKLNEKSAKINNIRDEMSPRNRGKKQILITFMPHFFYSLVTQLPISALNANELKEMGIVTQQA